MRNPNGLTFYPGSDVLWAVVNERDELGPNLVPGLHDLGEARRLLRLAVQLLGPARGPARAAAAPDLVKAAIPPDYGLSSHVAPLGLAFYTGKSFPAQFRGGAFIGEHGSWNRPELNGYKVVFIRFENGRPVGTADGLRHRLPQGRQSPRAPGRRGGRPGGALIVADDVGNTVWRVTRC